MSRLELAAPKKAETVMDGLLKDMERRVKASPPVKRPPLHPV